MATTSKSACNTLLLWASLMAGIFDRYFLYFRANPIGIRALIITINNVGSKLEFRKRTPLKCKELSSPAILTPIASNMPAAK